MEIIRFALDCVMREETMEEKKEKISISLIMAALVLFIYYFQASVWSESSRLSNITDPMGWLFPP